MSNNLRKYISQRPPKENDGWYDSHRVGEMSVSAMVGPSPDEGHTRGVQITLDEEYFQLTEHQARDLAMLLLRRVDSDDCIESTNWLGEFGAMDPDGSLVGRNLNHSYRMGWDDE